MVEVEIEVGVGLRLGLEVSEDEEAGQSGGEEYQDQPQRTHFETKRQRNVNKLEMRVRYRIVLRGLSFRFFLKRKKWEKGKSEEGGWVQLKLSQIRLLINSFCLQLCHTHDFSLYFYVCDLLFFFSFVLLHVFFFFLRGKSNFFLKDRVPRIRCS